MLQFFDGSTYSISNFHTAIRKPFFERVTDLVYSLTGYLTKYLPSVIGASRNTVLSYRDSFALLLKYCANIRGIKIEKLEISTLSRALIEDFLTWLETERSCCVSTRNQRLAAIHVLCKYMVLEDPTHLYLYQQILAIPGKKGCSKDRQLPLVGRHKGCAECS